MQFNSYLFILLFLPVCLIGWFGFGKKGLRPAKIWLAAACCLFCLYAGPKGAAVLAVSLAGNFLLARAIRKAPSGPWMAAGIGLNLLLLGWFKYSGFFLDSIRFFFPVGTAGRLFVPLGISFFTFQQIAYLVDCRRGECSPDSFLDYALFVLFFPKLIMGPLASPSDFTAQLRNPEICRPDGDNLVSGIQLFSMGLFKKAALADVFAAAAAAGLIPEAGSLSLWAGMLCYTLQIYFDFSGYSDMAIGSAMMLNLRLPMNFDSPYKALSIRDFWKRWHISLTQFFTRYLYIPLGGSRKGTVRTVCNTLAVFLLSGLWHGASWGFVLWGLCHGLLSVAERYWGRLQKKLPKVLRWGLTFLTVNLLWALFASGNAGVWFSVLAGLFSFRGTSMPTALTDPFYTAPWKFLSRVVRPVGAVLNTLPWIPMASYFVFGLVLCLCFENGCRRAKKATVPALLLTLAALLLGISSLAGEAVFVYMNF